MIIKSKIFQRWFIICATSFCLLAGSPAGEKEQTGFEILSHNAVVHIYPSSNSISCIDTLTLKLGESRQHEINVRLFLWFSVENISVDGRQANYSRDKEVLKIKDINSDSLASVVISYSGSPRYQSEFTKITPKRAVLRAEEILPYAKSTLQSVQLTLIVPSEWETIALGELLLRNTAQDSSVFVWRSTTPVETMGWICAGKFRSNGAKDENGNISVHLFDEDSSAAPNVIPYTADVMKFYSDKFSPYRFSKLDIVEVEDWVAGRNVLAIAAPSFIMVKKQAFTTNDKFNQVQSILAHEIAHQWWSHTIFPSDSDAAFLSEGMCEYSAHLYNESHGTMTSRDSLNRHPLLRPLLMRIQQGKDVPLRQKADLRSLLTHYLKAAYVHHMLRSTIGDTAFLELYHEYARRFSLKHVEMNDFQKLAEELSHKKLNWFFDEWVINSGVPRLKIYNVKTLKRNDDWITNGRVRLVGYDKFTIAGFVGAKTATVLEKKYFRLGTDSAGIYRNDVPFEIATKEKPLKVILDPDGDILKIQKIPPKMSDLRDPSNGLMIIGTLKHSENLLKLAKSDSVEMDKGGWSINIKYDTNVTLADLQQERVFIYGKPDENRVAADLEKKFTHNFRGDSIEINGEIISDSTLTLIQVIDNPFFANGTMTWIAPFSEKSAPELLPYDASWILLKGKEEISSGTWEVKDEDLIAEIK